MHHNILNITGFIFSAFVIVYSGSKLSRYADLLAESYGWGRMFMGMILLAFVTSVPELMTGLSSVLLIDSPDLAAGDIIGSCAFNILIISIMDFFYNPHKSLTTEMNTGHIITAALSIILMSIVGSAILFFEIFGHIAWIGGYSFIIIIVYLISLRIVYKYESKRKTESELLKEAPELSRKQIIFRFSFHSMIVIGSAGFLPFFGEHIAHAYNIEQGVFGTLFLAASTSLPEIVVSVAAIKLGKIDMAVGNIFGSNLFNFVILAIDDMLYFKGPILMYTDIKHIITVLGTIIITCIGIIGIVYKSNIKWKLAIDTALIVLVYIAIILLLINVK